MIRLNVFIQVSDENRDAVIDAAKELTAKSLQEPGCVAYDMFGSLTRNNVFMICETWKDELSLEAHEKSEHFATLVGRMQSLAQMKLEKFNF